MENKDNRNMEEEMDTASEAKAGEDAACEDSREAEMNPDKETEAADSGGDSGEGCKACGFEEDNSENSAECDASQDDDSAGEKEGFFKKKKKDKKEIDEKVTKMLALVGLAGFGNRDITSLSGGQQQRVAIARALVNEPKVLLLDEPLAALDAKLRKGMQAELKKIQKEVGITFIFVTHDQEEALSMSDTIVVMNDGIIQQIGTPMDIYNEPQNRFVANFIGESNIIEGVMPKDCLVVFDDVQWECVDKGFKENENIEVVLRPEDMQVVEPQDGKVSGKIVSKIFMGVHYEYLVETNIRKYKVHTTKNIEMGSVIGLTIDPFDIQVMHKMDN